MNQPSLRSYLLLFFCSLIFSMVLAYFEPIPGYLDSDYYYAGGLQLVAGKGFHEPYLWNYLDDPQGLPHPSHAYWMPLASILSAGGMWIYGESSYAASRILFILIAGFIPPVTAALAFTFSSKKELALISGFLAVFSGFHAPFLPVTDNFGIYILSGGLFFLISLKSRPWFWLGLISGAMTLARSDGLLWLILGIFLLGLRFRSMRSLSDFLFNGLLLFIGFFLIMGPWYLRNYQIYGTFMAPGGARTLWLGSYEQTFVYPAAQLNFESWLNLGWNEILRDRLWALNQNLQNAVAAHGSIILSPFILFGAWQHRADQRVQTGASGWLLLLAVMTLIFPFAGARGGFFHAGAAFQTLWWSLAPLGLTGLVDKAIQRGWFKEESEKIFRIALVQVVFLLSIYISWSRLFGLGWGEGEQKYVKVEDFIISRGAQPDEVVMVRNPPGYYMLTQRPAIVIPTGDEDTLLAAAQRYHSRYLVFEPQAALPQLMDLYKYPEKNQKFYYLGEIDDIRIYEIPID